MYWGVSYIHMINITILVGLRPSKKVQPPSANFSQFKHWFRRIGTSPEAKWPKIETKGQKRGGVLKVWHRTLSTPATGASKRAEAADFPILTGCILKQVKILHTM